MDSVEIYNCSQIDVLKAAMRFDGNTGSYSSISNSSIHSGLSWGVNIVNSKNIYISDTIVYYFTSIGINI